jgi:glycosyltransferase involved in cell wall biosynthesis
MHLGESTSHPTNQSVPEHPTLPPIAGQPVSAILLADNDGAHLEAVVAGWVSFFNGLDREYEIILVDDGSTDETVKLLTAIKDRHGRVKVVREESRQGEGAALKRGLAVARYPLLFYTVCHPAYQPGDFKRLLADIDKVHLISGFRGGHPVPTIVRFFESAFSLISHAVLSSSEPPLPGWLGWERHLGRLLVRIFFAVRSRDVGCPYRLIRREIFDRMPIQSKGTFVHAEILAKANFVGCLLGEEVVLGDRQQPIPLDRRGDPASRVLAEGFRLLQNPKFVPPAALDGKTEGQGTNLDAAPQTPL